jgi:hypothetical protein
MEPGCGSSTVFFPQDDSATAQTAATATIVLIFIIIDFKVIFNKYRDLKLKNQ